MMTTIQRFALKSHDSATRIFIAGGITRLLPVSRPARLVTVGPGSDEDIASVIRAINRYRKV